MAMKRNENNRGTKVERPSLGLTTSWAPGIPSRQVKAWPSSLQKRCYLEIRGGEATGALVGVWFPHSAGANQGALPYWENVLRECGQTLTQEALLTKDIHLLPIYAFGHGLLC